MSVSIGGRYANSEDYCRAILHSSNQRIVSSTTIIARATVAINATITQVIIRRRPGSSFTESCFIIAGWTFALDKRADRPV